MTHAEHVALVTGAGSGIGQAIAAALAAAGAKVLVHDLNPAAEEIADTIGGTFLPADLTDQAAVTDLAAAALAVHGRVDILVNNAGFQRIHTVEEFPLESWNAMLQVLLTAPFQLTSALLPQMKARSWGRIVNIASLHGLVASPYKSAYISAKHGLLGLTKTVALEAGPFGVTVNAICPAYVQTPLVDAQIADQARSRGIPPADVIERVMLEPAAIKRLIAPEEVAAYALFLCSPAGSVITGAAQVMDLGWTAR